MNAAALAALLLLPQMSGCDTAAFQLQSMSVEACEQASTLDDHSSQPDRVATHDVCRWAPLVVYLFGSVQISAELLCVMAFESGGDPGGELRHPAADGSTDIMTGLMQINHDDIQGRQPTGMERWKAQRHWKTDRLVMWLKNPVINLLVTRDRQAAAGWKPWAARHNCGLETPAQLEGETNGETPMVGGGRVPRHGHQPVLPGRGAAPAGTAGPGRRG